MAMRITDECTACGLCLPECPTSSIEEGDDIYTIDPETCNECEDQDEQQCIAVCPIEDCIVKAE